VTLAPYTEELVRISATDGTSMASVIAEGHAEHESVIPAKPLQMLLQRHKTAELVSILAVEPMVHQVRTFCPEMTAVVKIAGTGGAVPDLPEGVSVGQSFGEFHPATFASFIKKAVPADLGDDVKRLSVSLHPGTGTIEVRYSTATWTGRFVLAGVGPEQDRDR
jgi:hypothetical protein